MLGCARIAKEAAMAPWKLLAATLAGGLLVVGTAHAAVSIIGTGFARSCYEAAESGRATDEGFETCSRALAEQPLSVRDRAATFVNRGILHMRHRRHAAAISDYEAGLRLKRDLAEAYVNKGIALVHLGGRDAEAIELITRGIGLNPTQPEIAYYTRAVANEALGRTRAAYDDYRQAAALKPEWREPQNQLKRFTIVGRQG
jgi:tetratricopeptide (TPR) repeat protein